MNAWSRVQNPFSYMYYDFLFRKPTNHLFVWFCKDFFSFFFLSQNRKNRILKTKETFFFSFQKIEFFFSFQKTEFLKTEKKEFLKQKKSFFFLSEKESFFFPFRKQDPLFFFFYQFFFFQKNRISQNLKNKFLFFSLQPNQTPTMNFLFFFLHPNQSPTSCGVKKKFVLRLLENC